LRSAFLYAQTKTKMKKANNNADEASGKSGQANYEEMSDEELVQEWKLRWKGSQRDFCYDVEYKNDESYFSKYVRGKLVNSTATPSKPRRMIIKYLQNTDKQQANNAEDKQPEQITAGKVNASLVVENTVESVGEEVNQKEIFSNDVTSNKQELVSSTVHLQAQQQILKIPYKDDSDSEEEQEELNTKDSDSNTPIEQATSSDDNSDDESVSPLDASDIINSTKKNERNSWLLHVKNCKIVQPFIDKATTRCNQLFEKLRVVYVDKSLRDMDSKTKLSYMTILNQNEIFTLTENEQKQWQKHMLYTRVVKDIKVDKLNAKSRNIIYIALFRYSDANNQDHCKCYVGSAEKGVHDRWYGDGKSHCRMAMKCIVQHTETIERMQDAKIKSKQLPSLCDTMLACLAMPQILVFIVDQYQDSYDSLLPHNQSGKNLSPLERLEFKWMVDYDSVKSSVGLNMRNN